MIKNIHVILSKLSSQIGWEENYVPREKGEEC